MSDTFILGQGPGHKLEMAVNRNGGKATDIEWLSSGENFQAVMRLARGEATLEEKIKPIEPSFNTLIRVDRSVKPLYPNWIKEVLCPEFAETGPEQFDLANVELWLHGMQEKGSIAGNELYTYLRENDLLKDCLNLRDGEEIQKNGVRAFNKFFKVEALCLWKSAVSTDDGDFFVPYLRDAGGVVVRWGKLDDLWDRKSPAGRFRS